MPRKKRVSPAAPRRRTQAFLSIVLVLLAGLSIKIVYSVGAEKVPAAEKPRDGAGNNLTASVGRDGDIVQQINPIVQHFTPGEAKAVKEARKNCGIYDRTFVEGVAMLAAQVQSNRAVTDDLPGDISAIIDTELKFSQMLRPATKLVNASTNLDVIDKALRQVQERLKLPPKEGQTLRDVVQRELVSIQQFFTMRRNWLSNRVEEAIALSDPAEPAAASNDPVRPGNDPVPPSSANEAPTDRSTPALEAVSPSKR